MTTTTPDIARLCLALDRSDCSDLADLLTVLADALEDADDPRSAGLRILAARPDIGTPDTSPVLLTWAGEPGSNGMPFGFNRGYYAWRRAAESDDSMDARLVDAVFDRLPRFVGGLSVGYLIGARGCPDFHWGCRTRSAAYLALAEALTEVRS